MKFDADALIAARDRAGMTQEKLGAASKVTFSTISRLERKKLKRGPELETVTKLAEALGIPVSELLTENGADA